MVGVFRKNNPSNQGVLLLYGLLLKMAVFLQPEKILQLSYDGPVYKYLYSFLSTLPSAIPAFICVVLLLIQATWINRICKDFRLYTLNGALPGMSYLLITSFFPQWLVLSSTLLVSTIFIWIFYRIISLYNFYNIKSRLFNLGVWAGLAALIYLPAGLFLIFLVAAINTIRPFRVRENIMALIGFLSPFYVLYSVAYLLDKVHLLQLRWFSLQYPMPDVGTLTWVGIAVFLLAILPSVFLLNNNIPRQVVLVRKAWNLVVYYLLVTVLISFISLKGNMATWFPVCIPLALIIAAGFAYTNKKIFAVLLHWVMFILAICIGYFYGSFHF